MTHGMNLHQQVVRDPAELRRAVEAWLHSQPGWLEARVGQVRRPGSGGSANETLVVEVSRGDHSSVEQLVIRVLVPTVQPYLDTDLERQARTLRWMGEHTDVPVPNVLGVEQSTQLLGGEFMVMELVEGTPAPDYPGYNI